MLLGVLSTDRIDNDTPGVDKTVSKSFATQKQGFTDGRGWKKRVPVRMGATLLACTGVLRVRTTRRAGVANAEVCFDAKRRGVVWSLKRRNINFVPAHTFVWFSTRNISFGGAKTLYSRTHCLVSRSNSNGFLHALCGSKHRTKRHKKILNKSIVLTVRRLFNLS